jgi:tripartite ATP-independent transporter DctM subunit
MPVLLNSSAASRPPPFDPEPFMTIAIFLAALIGAVALGIPIAYSLLLAGVALMVHLGNFDAQILAQNVLEGANSFPLLAVPFFMLAGEIMNAGGLSRRIVDLAIALVGHVRGGLGYVTIIAACLMASLSGSAVADTAALTALLLPMMVRAGHQKARSGGLIASAGIIAPIIPPSIPFVIFGVTANVSIGKLFLAGIVPGLMMGIACAIAWWLTARTEAVVTPPKATGATLMKAFRDSTWALVLPLIVLVGLKFGVFTPTEAAVVAAVYAFFVATVVYRELSLKQLYEVFAASAKTTSIIMFMVAAAAVSAWLIAVADLPSQLISILEPFMQSPTTLLCILMLVLLMVGMVMDLTPTILILAPVMVPVVRAAGIDPVYFGVLFVMVGVIGLVTPPVGTVLNVVAGVGKMKMDQVARGVMPFLIADVIVLFLLVMFPALVLAPLDFFYK